MTEKDMVVFCGEEFMLLLIEYMKDNQNLQSQFNIFKTAHFENVKYKSFSPSNMNGIINYNNVIDSFHTQNVAIVTTTDKTVNAGTIIFNELLKQLATKFPDVKVCFLMDIYWKMN